jgi:hypothetical protein
LGFDGEEFAPGATCRRVSNMLPPSPTAALDCLSQAPPHGPLRDHDPAAARRRLAVGRRLKVPYPALLALAGLALGLLPDLPTVNLDPRVALTLFVAPVLLDAAFDSSPRDLKENWRAVAGLALGAVVVTVWPWAPWWSPCWRWRWSRGR